MAHKITLQPSGHEYEVPDGKSILDGGLAAGIAMAYSCRAGTCRTCRGTVVEGSVDYGMVLVDTYLTPEDKAKGYALLCVAKPLSDCVINVRVMEGLDGIVPRMTPCRVMKITKPAPDVAIVLLRLPMNENLRYLPGQYVEFLLKDGKRRSYSIANAPTAEGVIDLELHIRHLPGGLFTDHVFGAMKERELMRMEAPLGTFYLRESSTKPMILLASGTGFAPIKAIAEYAFQRGVNAKRPMTIYWGGRTKADLYMLELAQSWAAQQPNVTFVPVLSDATPACAWAGRTGFVHRAVMEDFPDLSTHQVYACGAPVMVDAARADFGARCELPEDEFFADSFITEKERAGA
jgi:CDP-4-dehydro-6-deoxyglucose reductase, E3